MIQRLQAVQQLNITDHVCRAERKTHTQTHWMYLSETFWLCLVVMVRMYICRAASRSAASYFSSGPNRSKTTSLQLCGRAGQRRYMRVSESCSREEPCIRPFRHSCSRVSPRRAEVGCSQPLWLEIPSKGYSFLSLMEDSEAQNCELWERKDDELSFTQAISLV